ncbi:MAG: hypothetical protein QXL15_05215, partial [Candidatus Korarchaeota archaeon]
PSHFACTKYRYFHKFFVFLCLNKLDDFFRVKCIMDQVPIENESYLECTNPTCPGVYHVECAQSKNCPLCRGKLILIKGPAKKENDEWNRGAGERN